MRVCAVVSEMGDEAELFVDRQMAELMVENWNRDWAREVARAGKSCALAAVSRSGRRSRGT